MDPAYFSSISTFVRDGNIEGVFLEVVPSSNLGVLARNEDERICSKYGNCGIPFYECTSSVLDIRMPFPTFEI